jgi:N-acetylneuraminate synthase
MNFKIDNLRFGNDFPCRIIVEIGINHNGNLDRAIYHAEIAIKAGAEIIKHQTHIADEEMSEEAKKIIPSNADESIYDVIKKSSLNEKEEIKLQKYVKQKKKVFISTPFSFAAVDRLVRMNVPAFKIGSGECNNYPLLKYISKFKKPVILSTGMNLINNIKKSVSILKKNPLVLLHCTNIYPTPSEHIKIDTINLLKKTFPKIPIGLSDHSSNLVACYSAIAMGACVVEKHFVVTKKQFGPDVSSSMDQQELKQLLNFSNEYFKIKGIKQQISSSEQATAKFAFGSVVSKTEIYKNEILNEKNITIKRPSSRDYLAKDINKVIGKKAIEDIAKNVIIKKRMIK